MALADGAGGAGADGPGTKWEFLGLLPLFDPPRHDTAHTIEQCQAMGIGGEGGGQVSLTGVACTHQGLIEANLDKLKVALAAANAAAVVVFAVRNA